MAKLIQLHEAAELLGISPEELTDMRSRNEVFGYRDGSTWKFKMQEIERLAAEKGLTLGGAKPAEGDADAIDADDSSSDIDLDDEIFAESSEEPDNDSILVSEEELGKSDDTTSSTIIGEADLLNPSESDIQLGHPGEGSELRLSADSKGASSDLELEANSDILSSDQPSDAAGAGDTANLELAASSGSNLRIESDADADSGSFNLSLSDELNLEESGELKLSDGSKASSSGFGSAIDLDLDDDELVLGSGSGSDVTTGTGDSGINLSNPSDSGLSLEDPLDLSAGSSVESLELGEDDMIVVDESVELDGATDMKADDDFLLTPVEDDGDESDSGSQVIALDSEEFDESAATMLAGDSALQEETVEFDAIDDDSRAVTPAGSLAATSAPAAGAAPVEAPYSIWNVLSLLVIVVFLGLSGIMLLDLINNIWSWNRNLPFNSAIMDTVLSMLGSSN